MIELCEIRRDIRQRYLSEDSIRKTAYNQWEKEGRPNGEDFRRTLFGMTKIKDCNWLVAKLILGLLADVDSRYIYMCLSLREIDPETGARW